MEQAAKFAESTQVLMNVSEFTDISQATDTLISSVQAFGYTAETSMEVVDLLNTIGNNYAISTADLAQSLTKSSASLVAAGGDLAEAAALTATANAIIQDADAVGTALKTTSLRLRGTSVEVLEEEGVDSDGAVESTSKLQSKVKALSGVDILTETGDYKSTYEILSQIADVWEDISNMDQAALLELLAGKRNASVLAAILQNPQDLKDAYEDANDAAGSAWEENEKYLDSIQGKIDQFNNSLQAMWSGTLNSDMVKGFVELGTVLIKILDSVGPLNVALVGLFTYLEKKHGLFSSLFKPEDSGIEEIKEQLAKAESDLAKATQADMQHGNKKTAQNRRDAEERVAILKSKIQESSSEAILDGIDDSFDPSKVKKSISSKKGAITKRATKLEGEGKTFAQIQEDPKIKQWTEEIKEGEQALDAYNAKVAQADIILKQKNATTDEGAKIDTIAALASDGKTASTWKDVIATAASKNATFADVGAKIKQLLIMKLLSMEYVKNKIKTGELTAAKLAEFTMTQLLTLGMKGLVASLWAGVKAAVAFIASLGPVVWIVTAVIAVIAGAIAVFAHFHKSSAELREELSGLKDEISGIKDEISSLNDELKTTQERMAELLAKDHLTFTEQEELENLQKQNDLLEREIYLLEQKEKRLQAQAQRTFDNLMGKEFANTKRDLDDDGEKDDVFDRSLERRIKQYKNRIEKHEEAQKELVQAERELETARASGDESAVRKAEREVERKEKKVERKEKRRNKKKGQIDGELAQYLEDAEGIDYESADPETRAYLDYINNTVGKVSILEGDAQAKSMEIKRIFNQTDMAGASKEIDALVEKLKQNPGDENIIAQISEQCKLAEGDLNAVGLSVQDAVDYFTMGGSSSSDYIMQQYGEAVKALNDLKSGAINLNDLVVYDSESGEATADITAIAEKLKGVSPEVRDQFSAIVEDIKEGAYDTKEGLVDWDSAIKKLELNGIQAVIASVKTELESANKLAFPDLEVSGWIDSVEELSGAFESLSSAMDLVVAAREQMDSSGRISMKTALDLMATTDDWTQILEVNNGVITMNAKAEQILIQSKLDLIKANIEMALQEVETQIALTEGAINSTKAGNAFTNGFTKALTNAQGVLVGLKASWDAFWAGTDVSSAFNNAYQQTINNLTPSQTALDDLYQQRDELNKKLNMIGGVDTTQEFKNNYDFDKTPGDKYKDDSDDEEDKFQEKMDYWENRISAKESQADQVQNEIDRLESQGKKAGEEYYQELINLENEKLDLYEQQKEDALEYLNSVEEGSDEWFLKKPACWETNKRNPLNCWNFLRALYTTTQG